MSPLSKGLFKRAILQSGAVYDNKNTPILPKSSALIQAKSYAKHFNCSGDQWVECLRKIDSKALNNNGITPYAIHETEFLPFTGQNAFKTQHYSTGMKLKSQFIKIINPFPEIDIMSGVMKNEGSSLAHGSYPGAEHLKNEEEFNQLVKRIRFGPELNYKNISEFYLKYVDKNSTEALKKAFWDFYGDIHITCPCYHFAKAFSEHTPKRNVYFYEWTYISPYGCPKEMGVCHGAEVGYVFGHPVLKNMADKKFSEDSMKIWTNFAKTGYYFKINN